MKKLIYLLCAALLCTSASAQTIQPGVRNTIVDYPNAIGSCTLGWVFDGTGSKAGQVFVAFAAHCTTRLNQPVSLLSNPLDVFGDTALIGNSFSSATDFALIKVRPDHVSRVNAAMLGYPQYPKGFTTTASARTGDSIRLTNLFFVPRAVPLLFTDSEVFRVAGTVNGQQISSQPFDSGGPLADTRTSQALGIDSRGIDPCQQPGILCAAYEGPTVEGIIAKSAAAGFPIVLRSSP